MRGSNAMCDCGIERFFSVKSENHNFSVFKYKIILLEQSGLSTFLVYRDEVTFSMKKKILVDVNICVLLKKLFNFYDLKFVLSITFYLQRVISFLFRRQQFPAMMDFFDEGLSFWVWQQ